MLWLSNQIFQCLCLTYCLLCWGPHDPLWKSVVTHKAWWRGSGVVFNWNHFEMMLLNLRINFYLLRTFCPHLGRWRSLISKWFQLKTITKKFGTEPTMEDQIRIYKTKNSILDRLSGPVAQRIEALSLYGSWWAQSEDGGFKSYPSRGAIDNCYGRQ